MRGDVRSFVTTHGEHVWTVLYCTVLYCTVLYCTVGEHVWTGRAVARVLHGIQSPNYPAQQWGKVFRSEHIIFIFCSIFIFFSIFIY